MRIAFYLSFLTLLTSNLSWGRYAVPDLEKVPIKTLIANLEKKLATATAEDSKAEIHHHLARAYGMAFAKNSFLRMTSKRTENLVQSGSAIQRTMFPLPSI